MKYDKYKIEEIEIGDQVYFDSTSSQSNFDEYWDVHEKRDNNLLINHNRTHYWTIDVKDVRQLIKLNKVEK